MRAKQYPIYYNEKCQFHVGFKLRGANFYFIYYIWFLFLLLLKKLSSIKAKGIGLFGNDFPNDPIQFSLNVR